MNLAQYSDAVREALAVVAKGTPPAVSVAEERLREELEVRGVDPSSVSIHTLAPGIVSGEVWQWLGTNDPTAE